MCFLAYLICIASRLVLFTYRRNNYLVAFERDSLGGIDKRKE